MTLDELGAAVEHWRKVTEMYAMSNTAGLTPVQAARLHVDAARAEAQYDAFCRQLLNAAEIDRQNQELLRAMR